MNNNSKENNIALPSTMIKNICKINHTDCVCTSSQTHNNVKESQQSQETKK